MRRVAIGALVVLALGLLSAAGSAQAMEWLCDGVAGKCKVKGENLEVVVFEDRGVPAAVECRVGAVKSEGTAGSGVVDETTKVEVEDGGAAPACTPSAKALNLKQEAETNGCGKVVSVSGVDLPWKTEIAEKEGESTWWDLISAGGARQPGYELVCETSGIKITDTCTSNSEHAPLVLLENGSEASVSAFFVAVPLEATQAATCTIGGKEQGFVIGEILLWDTGAGSEVLPLEIS